LKTKLLATAILVVFGILRMPIEQGLADQQRTLHYHGARLNLGTRQQLTQLGFVAALSGFRALVADVLYIKSYTVWQNTEWGRLKLMLEAVCALQPRCVTFWDMAGWHMAYNASVAAREDESLPPATRLRAEREYWKLGEDFLARGAVNNPDKAKLFELLGNLYRDKFVDHEKAAWAYAEAAKRSDAMMYVHRFALYYLAKVPGREREAYEGLKGLYLKSEDERLPTLVKLVGELEQKLNVPQDQRIYNSGTDKP
jgi:hypothetical protein